MMPTVMTHMVAWYPDRDRSLEAAAALAAGGASYLEIQFPFSDPMADGPVIQAACTKALEAGFTLSGGFDLIRQITSMVDIPVYIMSYASPAVSMGVERFVTSARQAGASGCIIPDLPVGCDEGFFAYSKSIGMDAVPVIAPNVTHKRLEEILSVSPRYVYTALRAGITGTQTVLDQPLIDFLSVLSAQKVKVLGGFGISSSEQIRALSPYVHAVVVGSHLVRAITEAVSHGSSVSESIRSAMKQWEQ